jgi:hypothetical protein
LKGCNKSCPRAFVPFCLLLASYLLFDSSSLYAKQTPLLWRRLLHYEDNPHQSAIDNRSFFLDANGSKDPHAELATTINLMTRNQPVIKDGKAIDPICTFPARAFYLQHFAKIRLPDADCPELRSWRDQLNIKSLSIVFAASYASNAASMFGHTFLKINLDTDKYGEMEHPHLLDYGLAFFAAADSSEGARYVLKGLSGGYDGFYVIQPYYELLNQYVFIEGRDLWEYELALDDEKKQLLQLHLWELTHLASTPYYFTHKNCSSMLAGILELLFENANIKDHFGLFAYPSDLIRAVAKELPYRKIHYRPSIRNRLATRWAALNREEKDEVLREWNQKSSPIASKSPAVLDTLLDLVTLDKAKKELNEQSAVREREKLLLRARSQYERSQPLLPQSQNGDPLDAHGASRIAIGMAQKGANSGLGLELRYGWHGLLDPEEGFSPYYQLNIFDLAYYRSTADKGSRERYQLKIADIVSYAPTTPYESLWSWTMQGGISKEQDEPELYFESSVGKAWELNGQRSSLVAALPFSKLSLPSQSSKKAHLTGGLDVTLLARPSPPLGILWNLRYGCTLNHKQIAATCREVLLLKMQYALDRAKNIGLAITREDEFLAVLTYGVFL